jgi:hypothetical protein
MLMAPPNNNEGAFEVNKQYQEAIKIVINLVTASLVLPVVFLKNIVGADPNRIGSLLSGWAYASWIFLGASLLACVAFYVYSTKYTKALYGLYKDNNENEEKRVENWRDRWARFATMTAVLGLVLLLIFLWQATEAQERHQVSQGIPLGNHFTTELLPSGTVLG